LFLKNKVNPSCRRDSVPPGRPGLDGDGMMCSSPPGRRRTDNRKRERIIE
jgi:hypothetical protein